MSKTYKIAAIVLTPKSAAAPEANRPAGVQANNTSKCVEWEGSAEEMDGLLGNFIVGVRLFEDSAELKAWTTEQREDHAKFTFGAPKSLTFAIDIKPYTLG